MAARTPLRTADAVKVVKIAQAMDLNQIEIVCLEKFEAGFYRAQGTVLVSRINLGGEKDFFAPLLGKLSEPFLAQPFQWPPRIGSRGIKIVDSKCESALEQCLRGNLVLNGTETSAGTESDARHHFSSFPETAFRQC